MHRIFPQNLKPGDKIIWKSVEAQVLSLRELDTNCEINVKISDGDLRNWVLSKSDKLELLSTEDAQRNEPPSPSLAEHSDAVGTHPIGGPLIRTTQKVK